MPNRFRHALLIITLASSVAACGGGGGGGGPSPGGNTGVTPIDPASLTFIAEYYPELKAEASYPSRWRKEILAFDPNIVAAFIEPQTSSSDTFQENVALVTVVGSNLRDVSGVTGIQVVSSQPFTIGGLAGEEVIFDGAFPGVSGEYRFMEISYTQGDTTHGLFYSAERDQFARNREVVRHMADRWRAGRIVFDDFFLGSDLETPGNSPIASDGNNFLVVSCRESGDFPYPADLVARIISPDRNLLGNEILVHADVAGNSGCRYTRPRLTFDGTNFLVTYLTLIDGRLAIAAKRVSPAGQLLDNTPINVSMNPVDAAFEPAAAFTGTRHLVVWHEDVSNDINDVVRGAFVDTDGTVSPSFVVFDELRSLYPDQYGNFLSRPEIAVGNNRVLVVLAPRFARDVQQPSQSLYAQLLDFDGNPQLAAPLLVREDTGDNPRYPQVAFDGQSFLVAWIEGLLEEGTISAGLFGIYGREVSEAGQLINGSAATTGLTIAEPAADRPREDLNLTYSNGRYYLLWSHTSFASDLGIYGTEIEAGTFAVQPERAISALESESYNDFFPRLSNPALGHGPTQRLVVWPVRDGTVDAWIYE